MFKVGDVVVCIKERTYPELIGTTWIVVAHTEDNLFRTEPLSSTLLEDLDYYVFGDDEIILSTPLIRELV